MRPPAKVANRSSALGNGILINISTLIYSCLVISTYTITINSLNFRSVHPLWNILNIPCREGFSFLETAHLGHMPLSLTFEALHSSEPTHRWLMLMMLTTTLLNLLTLFKDSSWGKLTSQTSSSFAISMDCTVSNAFLKVKSLSANNFFWIWTFSSPHTGQSHKPSSRKTPNSHFNASHFNSTTQNEWFTMMVKLERLKFLSKLQVTYLSAGPGPAYCEELHKHPLHSTTGMLKPRGPSQCNSLQNTVLPAKCNSQCLLSLHIFSNVTHQGHFQILVARIVIFEAQN